MENKYFRTIISQDSSCTQIPIINTEFLGMSDNEELLLQRTKKVLQSMMIEHIQENNLKIPQEDILEMVSSGYYYNCSDNPTYELTINNPDIIRRFYAEEFTEGKF